MIFKYKYFEGKFLPVVPIKLKGKTEWLETMAFVDTGASYSLFHADIATILEIDLESGAKWEMVVGDGNVLVTYLHKVLVSIAGKEFVATIGFSKGLGVGFYIVGRKSIFDNFLVCFDEKEKQIEFKPNS